MALKCVEACKIRGVEFLDMRLIQLNPAVPDKTTNCVSSALNFAAQPEKVRDLLEFVRSFVENNTFSRDTGIAYSHGIRDFTDVLIARRIKTEILERRQAEREAKALGIEFLDRNAKKGRIGALGAVVWGSQGSEAAGLYGEHL
jgi:tRNA(Ile2) C34 agmatinyltransferase TiaS